MKTILRSTLRYNIESKVLNSAPKSVSILRAAEAILFGSNPLEHKWYDEYVNQSVFFLLYGCYMFSPFVRTTLTYLNWYHLNRFKANKS